MDNSVKRFETFGYAFILVFLAIFLYTRFSNTISDMTGPLFIIISTILFVGFIVIFIGLCYFALRYALYLIDMFILSIPYFKINNQTFYCQKCKVIVEQEDEYCSNCGILL